MIKKNSKTKQIECKMIHVFSRSFFFFFIRGGGRGAFLPSTFFIIFHNLNFTTLSRVLCTRSTHEIHHPITHPMQLENSTFKCHDLHQKCSRVCLYTEQANQIVFVSVENRIFPQKICHKIHGNETTTTTNPPKTMPLNLQAIFDWAVTVSAWHKKSVPFFPSFHFEWNGFGCTIAHCSQLECEILIISINGMQCISLVDGNDGVDNKSFNTFVLGAHWMKSKVLWFPSRRIFTLV